MTTLLVALAVGCSEEGSTGGDVGVVDDGMNDDGADDGGMDDDGSTSVPDTDYCRGVADWTMEEAAFERAVLDLVNQARASGANCGGMEFGPTTPLSMESRLRCAARVHSLDMATRGFFDHQNPQGQSPFDRMEEAGYEYRAAGENIAAGQSSPEPVVAGWLDSPGHCSNIMNPDFADLGVGYAPGGTEAPFPHYWTQVFGTAL
ncbi:MAG: CAP domain-containing protein [Deltaproteobacteria bacterium]|nr:CAP domain-containing protein [Deltaproteobacteria bacterium]